MRSKIEIELKIMRLLQKENSFVKLWINILEDVLNKYPDDELRKGLNQSFVKFTILKVGIMEYSSNHKIDSELNKHLEDANYILENLKFILW